ncbi:hypothetical protein ASPWEDRAFT_745350 [Aspergillus wentii DTO 134E9]|uniref:Uncharacterized protein n=1 Tax=Aspergillus wentii DTO 134E9 TaxID=1073089 RepID=A0A1L9RAF1_ASPWE|nr:uncharacterized protein ASPWEDRAFT_745350 [Aspergillus wentii DTO 134E9]OJJ31906.1 hypothetical protein ASPWEDRAFT_745350 [Aspergillus wentii DTO 134E9]
MVDLSEGVPFSKQNLHEGNRYIKRGQTLFPCPSSVNASTFFDLAPDEEVVSVLAKPMARIILEYDFSIVTKSGHGVRPAEAEAMRLISRYTTVPAMRCRWLPLKRPLTRKSPITTPTPNQRFRPTGSHLRALSPLRG